MENSRAKRRGMPSKEKIREYWQDKLSEMGKIDCYSEEIDCFCCGLPRRLERAHIKPLVYGGNNDLDNLHLLCRSCHDESEHLNGVLYWDWFGSKDIEEEHYRWSMDLFRRSKPLAERLLKTHPNIANLSFEEIREIVLNEIEEFNGNNN